MLLPIIHHHVFTHDSWWSLVLTLRVRHVASGNKSTSDLEPSLLLLRKTTYLAFRDQSYPQRSDHLSESVLWVTKCPDLTRFSWSELSTKKRSFVTLSIKVPRYDVYLERESRASSSGGGKAIIGRDVKKLLSEDFLGVWNLTVGEVFEGESLFPVVRSSFHFVT